MFPAMVLAAGLGTRLRPLTDRCAKALVPIGDRPALAHVIERLRVAGAPRVVVNAHHRAEDVRRFVAAAGPGVAVSDEPDRLGTAGGLARAAALLGEGAVVVWNADLFADVDVAGLVRAHVTGGSGSGSGSGSGPGPGAGLPAATLVVQSRPRGEGPLGLDRGGAIVRLRGERFGEEDRGADFLGVSIQGARLRADLPERGCLVADAWLPRLRAGEVLRSFEHAGAWHDIGTVRRYLEANRSWLRAANRSRWVGPGAACVADVDLAETVVGAGATVTGSGALTRCVVWPGARARAPLVDAVVLPDQVVPAPAE